MTTGKGIDLSIAADTRSAMSAIQRGIIDPLEDVSDLFDSLGTDSADSMRDVQRNTDRAGDALDDLGRDGKDAGNKLERAANDAGQELDGLGRDGKSAGDKLEQSMRDAQRRTDDAKDEISDLRNELNKAGRASKDIGVEGQAGFGKVKEGAGELKQEIGQNLGEAVSSFKGDLTDLTQVGQDTLGGLAATVSAVPGFGIPAAIGLAAGAAGWGLLTQNMEAQKEKQEEINQLAADMVGIYEDSVDGSIDAVALLTAANDQVTNNLDEVKQNAKDWGVDYTTAARAMSGSTDDLAIVQANLSQKQNEATSALKKYNKEGEENWHTNMDLTKAEKDLVSQVKDGTSSYEKYSGAASGAAERSRLMAENLYRTATATGKATGETDKLGDAIYKLPDGTEVVVNAETKTAYKDLNTFYANLRKRPSTSKIRLLVDDSDVRNYRAPAVIGKTWVQIGTRSATWQ